MDQTGSDAARLLHRPRCSPPTHCAPLASLCRGRWVRIENHHHHRRLSSWIFSHISVVHAGRARLLSRLESRSTLSQQRTDGRCPGSTPAASTTAAVMRRSHLTTPATSRAPSSRASATMSEPTESEIKRMVLPGTRRGAAKGSRAPEHRSLTALRPPADLRAALRSRGLTPAGGIEALRRACAARGGGGVGGASGRGAPLGRAPRSLPPASAHAALFPVPPRSAPDRVRAGCGVRRDPERSFGRRGRRGLRQRGADANRLRRRRRHPVRARPHQQQLCAPPPRPGGGAGRAAAPPRSGRACAPPAAHPPRRPPPPDARPDGQARPPRPLRRPGAAVDRRSRRPLAAPAPSRLPSPSSLCITSHTHTSHLTRRPDLI